MLTTLKKMEELFILDGRKLYLKYYNFFGILHDVKIYPKKAFLEKLELRGMLCNYNEFS